MHFKTSCGGGPDWPVGHNFGHPLDDGPQIMKAEPGGGGKLRLQGCWGFLGLRVWGVGALGGLRVWVSGFGRVEGLMGLRILKRILELRPWSSVCAVEDPRSSWGLPEQRWHAATPLPNGEPEPD